MNVIPFPKNDWGLGTAYERVAVYRLLDQWLGGRAPRNVMEGPVDGMAGVPGIHFLGLARSGVSVDVKLTDAAALENVRRIYETLGLGDRLTTGLCRLEEQLPEKRWDAVLLYNPFPLVDDWRGLLHRTARTARRWFLVAVTNPDSYGATIRKTIRVIEPEKKAELFDHDSTKARILEPELEKIGRVVEHAYFDCPWWPDLFVDAGESLLGATLKRLPVVGPTFAARQQKAASAPAEFVYGAGNFPLFEPGSHLETTLRRHPVFDRFPQPVARLFGHLHAYLVEVG